MSAPSAYPSSYPQFKSSFVQMSDLLSPTIIPQPMSNTTLLTSRRTDLDPAISTPGLILPSTSTIQSFPSLLPSLHPITPHQGNTSPSSKWCRCGSRYPLVAQLKCLLRHSDTATSLSSIISDIFLFIRTIVAIMAPTNRSISKIHSIKNTHWHPLHFSLEKFIAKNCDISVIKSVKKEDQIPT